MDPTIGRIVLYKLTADDAKAMNRRRTTGKSIAARLLWGIVGQHTETLPADSEDGSVRAWPAGAQAHIGNEVHEGDVVPMIIVRVWSPTTVNGQAFMDGNDVLWVTSATLGDNPHEWQWPPRV